LAGVSSFPFSCAEYRTIQTFFDRIPNTKALAELGILVHWYIGTFAHSNRPEEDANSVFPHPEIIHFAPRAGRIFFDGKHAGRTEYEKSFLGLELPRRLSSGIGHSL